MYLKKRGTILISSVVILSLITIIGSFMFKMMRDNNKLSSLYNCNKDIYDLNEDEEKILYEFMVNINKKISEKPDDPDIFLEDFQMENEKSKLKYFSGNNKLLLITNKPNDLIREREIVYFYKEEKVILIPTYKFQDKLK